MKQTNLLKGLLAIVVLLYSAHSWAYDFEVDNIQYTILSLDDMTVEVSGLSNDSVTEVLIPETVEYRSRTLTVTSIGSNAFYNCTSLSQVTIGNNVITIGKEAFYGCSSLTNVTIPNSVTTIGDTAFYGCTGLKTVNFNATACTSVPSSTFSGCDKISTMNFGDNVTIIPDYLCYHLYCLTEVTIPNSVTTIGNYAFSGCSSLTGVTIPNSVTSIGIYAFAYCSGLTEITIPQSVPSIGEAAFKDCTSLRKVTLPESVTSIGRYAFYNCASLKELDIPNSVTTLGSYALEGCTNLENLQIGAGIAYLYDYCSWKAISESKSYYYYYPSLWIEGPSNMDSIILKDCTSDFSVRGYGYCLGNLSSPQYGTITPQKGYPMFSNINVGYYYVGRPLIDIDSWTYWYDGADMKYEISISQPYGTIKTLEIGGYCTEVPYFYQSIEYLVLGENVETYEAENIYQDKLKGIICRSAVPPTLSGTFENNNYLNTIVYVPTGSKAIYEVTDGWKTFWNIQELDMQSIPPGYTDAVESTLAERGTPDVSVADGSIVVNGAKGETIHVYNMQGQLIYSGHDTVIPISHHGIYVVNVAGKSKKVSL